MIPLRDSTRSRTFPVLTVSIIILNLYIFFRQNMCSPQELEYFMLNYALIPAHFIQRIQDLSVFGLLYPPLVTSTFLHGSWFHVIFNMLYLWIFGDNIEDKLGKVRFLLFYFLTGIAANLAQVISDPFSPIPLVGASGAIAGVLGAYLITFPRARITSVIFVFFLFFIREIPAIFFLLIWFATQVLNGITSLGIMGNTVAWWAHIGGFVAGIVFMRILKPREKYYI